MTPAEARQIVAAQIAARAVRAVDWDEYPEIGEYDWFAVVDELDALCPEVPVDSYDVAYTLLVERAET